MYNHSRLAFALVIALTAPPFLHAQFQQPAADELSMTSDPKAPGAAAVYLNVEEKTEDAVHYHSFYARIKVLTEKGKELATIRVPYERGEVQVAAVQGRTIHPDGSIVRLQGKPSDLLQYKGGGHQFNDVTFTLPAVTVGSILEYYYQIRYSEDNVSSPVWTIQQDYFVHKAHYFFNPAFNSGDQVVDEHGQIAGGLMYATRLPYGGSVIQDTKHRYTLDVTDVPPMPTGDYLPPVNNLVESVIFFYTEVHSGQEFWDREGKFWARNVERFTAASGPVKKAAADLVDSADTDEAKARKIYAAVMKLDNLDFSNGLAPAKLKGNKDAAAVLKQQRGTSDDLALLYVALARAAGLRAWPMQVVNRNRAAYEPTNLSMNQFDDYIVVLQLEGKDVYLDPGEKMCPFGVMHWKHELTKGFRLSDKGVSLEETPAGPPKAAAVKRFAEVTIDDKGAVTGTGRIVLGGQEALHWRQLALLEEKEALAKDFNEYLAQSLPEGVVGSLEGFDDVAAYDSDLTGHIRISGSLGSLTAKRLILPAFLFEARGKHPFVEDEGREVPVDLHYATMEEDEVVYHLSPAGKLDSPPRDEDFDWASRIGFSTRFKQADNGITVKRTFIRTAAVIDPSLYNNLRYSYKRVSSADQLQLVFDRADQAAKN